MTHEEAKNKVSIDWLESCPKCDEKSLYVKTIRTDGKLDELDDVACSCGNTGYIEIYNGCAFVCWDELTEDDFKYNKLKIMYDRAIECLMESNYGDVKYLKNRGAIE